MKVMMKKLLASLFIGKALLAPMTSFAYTDCSGPVKNTFIADGGVYVFLTTGASGFMPSSDINTKYVFASATAGLMGDRQVTIRFQANGLTCNTAVMQLMVGMGLY